MASTRDRQRQLERARTQRRIAREAHRIRRRRQVQAGVGGGIALVLIVLGTIWALGGFDGSASTPEAGTCAWNPIDPSTNPNVVDVGMPPTSGEPRSGTEQMAIATNLGEIDITLDLAKSPCAAASFAYLGGQNFFANSSCSLLSKQLEVLQCGDPKSTGAGGPAYQFADEYRPSAPLFTPSPSPSSPTPNPSVSAASGVYYKRGQVVMVTGGEDTNGSQFYIVYGDSSTLSPAYTLIGEVTTGMDVIDKVVNDGALGDNGKPSDQGKPKTALTFQSLTVSQPPPASPTPTGSSPASATPSTPTS